MTDHVFVCGGERARAADADSAVSLALAGREPNVSLRVAGLSAAAVARVPAALVDLLELAAYVFAADPLVARVRGEGANLRFVVALRDDALWNSTGKRALRDALETLTGDGYAFDFRAKRRASRDPSPFEIPTPDAATQADRVVLFSGGIDSFAGAAAALDESVGNVALVTHRSSPRLDPRVDRLAESLRSRASNNSAPVEINGWVRADPALHGGARRRLARTRGFLYAALAAVAAVALEAERIDAYENGVVSFDLPVTALVLGAHAARTTHPRVLAAFSRLFTLVAGRSLVVENPFVFRTKGEVVRSLGERNLEAKLRDTLSCTRARGDRHCGLCMACIDRRFSTLAAGLESHDPLARYEIDPIAGARPPSPSRAIVERYLKTSMEVAEISDEAFFGRFGDVVRDLSLVGASTHDGASQVLALHRRHAEEIQRVLDLEMARHARALRSGRLPKSSLLYACLPTAPPSPHPALTSTLENTYISRVPPTTTSAVRLLHLSDFHFSTRRAWDQDPVVLALAHDVAALTKTAPIDLVVITGDLADRASPAEYERAATWIRDALLPAAKLTTKSLLLVPGNHDVDRSAVSRSAQIVQHQLVRGESEDAIAEVLADPDQRGLLIKRHEAWLAFLRGLDTGVDTTFPWWSAIRDIRGHSLHFAGMCSSWASWGDEDKGHLLLGRYQTHAVLKDAAKADLSIALLHHPWDYFAEFDAMETREAVHRACHVVMRGHLHRLDGRAMVRPGGEVLELATGACYAGSKYPNAYEIVELDLAKGHREARVQMRVWDDHAWIADRNAYGGATPDGVARFTLR